jgi:hypothetical protein
MEDMAEATAEGTTAEGVTTAAVVIMVEGVITAEGVTTAEEVTTEAGDASVALLKKFKPSPFRKN